jgi:hypothetical protein
MWANHGTGVAAMVAFAVAATAAVAMGTVAHDRGDEIASERDRNTVLVAEQARTDQQIQRLKARIDAIDAPSLRGEIARLQRLADRRDAEIRSLRAMFGSIRMCSAAGMSAPSLPNTLPAETSATAGVILDAATSCDLPVLAKLAVHDQTYPFEYGLDATVPPALYWTREEFEGKAPMRHLVELFGLPVGTTFAPGTGMGRLYVWPSAAAYGDWTDVPAAEQEAVRAWYAADSRPVPLYEGNYWGWRVVIAADGSWRVFLSSPD